MTGWLADRQAEERNEPLDTVKWTMSSKDGKVRKRRSDEEKKKKTEGQKA